jgi:hypothetical protein
MHIKGGGGLQHTQPTNRVVWPAPAPTHGMHTSHAHLLSTAALAPLPSSARTTSACPFRQAQCRGVLPPLLVASAFCVCGGGGGGAAAGSSASRAVEGWRRQPLRSVLLQHGMCRTMLGRQRHHAAAAAAAVCVTHRARLQQQAHDVEVPVGARHVQRCVERGRQANTVGGGGQS